VAGQHLQPIHRLRPEPRAQALDELRRFAANVAAVLARLPQGAGGQRIADESARAKLARAYGLRQRNRTQSLAEQLAQTIRIETRSGKPKHAARRGRMTMAQETLQLNDAALTFPQ